MNEIYLAIVLAAKTNSAHQIFEQPQVSAASALVMDRDSGRLLYFKNVDTKRYPASTTKIMTGLLLAELTQPTDIIKAPNDIKTVKGSSMHLEPGERVSAEDMLYALMIRSANDGCYAVAKHISGSVAEFCKLMNERAKAIGCTHTDFHNPHGLNDDKHITTARDLALMGREAMKNPQFAQAVGTRERWVTRSINQKDLLMKSKNKWLELDVTGNGIKTGFTNPAGKCFVGSVERDDIRLITVVLKSEDYVIDTTALVEWAYATHRRGTLIATGMPAGTADVENGQSEKVKMEAAEDLIDIVPYDGPAKFKVFPLNKAKLQAPVTKGQDLGTAAIVFPDGFKRIIKVRAAEDVPAKLTIAGLITKPMNLVWLALLGGGAYWVKSRARAMYRTNARPQTRSRSSYRPGSPAPIYRTGGNQQSSQSRRTDSRRQGRSQWSDRHRDGGQGRPRGRG